MHPGDDRTRWILHADRGRNRIEPHPRLRATVSRTHAVGLVAEAPGDDCLLALHAPDERAGEASFPHNGFRICNKIFVFDDARRKKRPGHPARDDGDHQPDVVPLGYLAELLEPRHSAGIEPERIVNLLVGAVAQNEGRRPLILLLLPNRLKLAPGRKDTHQLDAVRRKCGYVFFDGRFVPFVCAPHPDARLRAPEIDAHKHFPLNGERPSRGNRRGESRGECCQLGYRERLVGSGRHVAVGRTLHELGRNGALHVVVAQEDSARRTRQVAESQARYLHFASRGNTLRVKRGIEVERPVGMRNAPRIGDERTALTERVSEVAAPGDLRTRSCQAVDKAGRPHRLQSALATS